MRTIQTFSLLAICTAALPAQWAQITPTTSPSQRRAGAMAFDPVSNRLVMYGGLSATPSQLLSEMWSYNGQWTPIAPVGGAPGRWGHQMVLDTASNRIMTFGGRSPNVSGLANDTAEWSGTAWVPVATPTAPSARFLYGMGYDSARSVLVLFGGRTAQGMVDDTWEFNGVSWTQVTTADSPAPREEMAMTFDTGLNRTVLFGGCDDLANQVFGDTWLYDGNNWVEIAPATSPSARFRCASVFDSVRKRMVLYGGFDGTQIVTDTFEFTGSNWNLIATGVTVPQNATEVYAGYDPVRRKFALFGGFSGSFSNATWEYTGANTGVFATFGEGCETSAGPVGLTGTTPRIGQTLNVTADNLPTGVEAVVFAVGLTNQTWQGMPLPLNLGLIGLVGCNLQVSADLIELRLAAGNAATYSLAIPNQAALVNQIVYVQGLVTDLAPTFTFLGSTPGGMAIIGN